jgi:hypothetical protein
MLIGQGNFEFGGLWGFVRHEMGHSQMSGKSNDEFSAEEAKLRMEAALRGARLAGHMPMKTKKAAKKTKPKKKKR